MADCLTEHAAATNTDLTQAVDELTLASEGPSETTDDTSLVLWEGTLYANPALLTTVNSDSIDLDAYAGEVAKFPGLVLAVETEQEIEQLSLTPVTLVLVDICQVSTIPLPMRRHIYCDVWVAPEHVATQTLFNAILTNGGLDASGNSSLGMLVQATSEARLQWTSSGKIEMNPFVSRDIDQMRSLQLPRSLLLYAVKIETPDTESTLQLRAEWLWDYDAFQPLHANTLDIIPRQIDDVDEHHMEEALDLLKEIPGPEISVSPTKRKDLRQPYLPETVYLEHLTTQVKSRSTHAVRTPTCIRKRLSRRDRTIITRLQDSPASSVVRPTPQQKSSLQASSQQRTQRRTSSASLSSLKESEPNSSASSNQCEEINKKTMKNLVLLALRTIGVDRKHPEFRACWSHLYKGVQFAMRKDIAVRLISTDDIRREVDRQLHFIQQTL